MYGDTTDVQELLWGAARPAVPPAVTTALETATDIINDELNLNKELTGNDIPPKLHKIATLLAVGILQESRKPEVKSQSTLRGETMLQRFKDDTTETSRGESVHIRILDDEE